MNVIIDHVAGGIFGAGAGFAYGSLKVGIISLIVFGILKAIKNPNLSLQVKPLVLVTLFGGGVAAMIFGFAGLCVGLDGFGR
ncbi:MAG: hypothetical protein KDK44_03950 [Chlamydiia bacterium]|nr:hypothetical protein [Chlamydiia bacterium]MCP5509854.1 hypothetical protein [Chlamydiales bacterium]